MPVPVEQDQRETNSGLAQPAIALRTSSSPSLAIRTASAGVPQGTIALGPDFPFRLPYLEPYAGVP